MLKMVKVNILVDLVEEDLAVVHKCQTDPEGKDLAAEEVEVEEEASVEVSVALLQQLILGKKALNTLHLRTWILGESTFHLPKIGITRNTSVH